LLHAVAALHATRRLARRLNRRQKQSNQNADDGDHHKKFHQRKCAPIAQEPI